MRQAEPSRTTLSGIKTVYDRLMAAASACGLLLTVFILFLINADILGRWLFDAPVRAVPEIVSLVIVAIVYLQAPSTALALRMIRSEGLAGMLESRAPKVARWLNVLFDIIMIAIFGIIAVYSFPDFLTAIRDDYFIGVHGDLTIPVWPVLAVVAFGAAAMALGALLNLLLSLALGGQGER